MLTNLQSNVTKMSEAIQKTQIKSGQNLESIKKSSRKSSFVTKFFKLGKKKKCSTKAVSNGLSDAECNTLSSSKKHISILHGHNIGSKMVKVLNYNTQSNDSITLPNGNSTLLNGHPTNSILGTQTSSTPRSPVKSGINSKFSSVKKNYYIPNTTTINHNRVLIGNLSISNTREVKYYYGNTETSSKSDAAHFLNSSPHATRTGSLRSLHNSVNSASLLDGKVRDNSTLIHSTTREDVHSPQNNRKLTEPTQKDPRNQVVSSSVTTESPLVVTIVMNHTDKPTNNSNIFQIDGPHQMTSNQEAYVKVDLITYNNLLSELSYLKTQLGHLQQMLT